ncbi:alpha/beta fold hydrolase [Desulfococcus sp.]|uniref:alpha/beta fold hydrolase n=1 Tax=Desulfococcus sp. TaxID=2025834 RepID=UPI003D0B22A0
MPVTAVDKKMLYYDRSDSETGPALILVHGSGGDHTHWPEGLRHHRGIRVYTPDLPGHGRSSGVGCTSVEAYADVIDRFARSLGIEKAAVAGHSLGGAVALTLAIRKPGWLNGAILVGTGARLRVLPKIIDGFENAFEETIDMICRQSIGPRASASLKAALQHQMLHNEPDVISGDYLACDHFDVMDDIGNIDCPALVISATDDRMTPVKYGQYLSRHIPGATFALIEGAGHMMAVEKPEALIAEVVRFLGIPSEK